MPANSTGWVWHCLARETGKIGHLFSPGAERGPWPWFPYALDNGAFPCWDAATNTFDHEKWKGTEATWRRLLFWCDCATQKPMWAIVPDVPGNREETIQRWPKFAPLVQMHRIPLAVAVQDGMTPADVRKLNPPPELIAIGGSTEWKWNTVEMWAHEFKRVHLLRCNAPDRLEYLEGIGIESTDGTGWNRGNRNQTQGLEKWARATASHVSDHELWPHVCRTSQDKNQTTFA